MSLTGIVCGAVADRISNSFYSRLYKMSGEDTQLGLLRLSYIETIIFDMVNEYSFKGT